MGFKTLPSTTTDSALTVASVAALSAVQDPQEGDVRWVEDINVFYGYSGSAWAPAAASTTSPLAPSAGGTGVSNGDSATLTRSGAHALTVTTTGTTNSTLPVGTKTLVASGDIVNADLAAGAAIVDTKLATISTAGKVSNSATTATDANTASAIVARDGSGNFTAGTITAALNGNASTVTTNANLTGIVTSVGNATAIADGAIAGAKVAAATASLTGVVSGGTVPGSTSGSAVAAGYLGEEFTCGAVTSTASSGSANTMTAITGATITVTAGIWLVTWAAAYTSGDQSVIGVSDDAGTSFVAKSHKTTGIMASSNTIGATVLYRCSTGKTLALYMKSKGSATCTVFTDDAIGSTLTNDGGTHITAVRIG